MEPVSNLKINAEICIHPGDIKYIAMDKEKIKAHVPVKTRNSITINETTGEPIERQNQWFWPSYLPLNSIPTHHTQFDSYVQVGNVFDESNSNIGIGIGSLTKNNKFIPSIPFDGGEGKYTEDHFFVPVTITLLKAPNSDETFHELLQQKLQKFNTQEPPLESMPFLSEEEGKTLAIKQNKVEFNPETKKLQLGTHQALKKLKRKSPGNITTKLNQRQLNGEMRPSKKRRIEGPSTTNTEPTI